MTHFVQNMEKSGDLLKVSQTEPSAFEVGRNLRSPPGQIIFQNDILQLIQYAPTTDKVRGSPALDRAAMDQQVLHPRSDPGEELHQVSPSIRASQSSWSPGSTPTNTSPTRLSRTTCRRYPDRRRCGAARDGRDKCNVLGYCVGGTLLATTLAYLPRGAKRPSVRQRSSRRKSISGTPAISAVHQRRKARLAGGDDGGRGYLDGPRMANVFNMMRPKDLIWPTWSTTTCLARSRSPSTCSTGTRTPRGYPRPTTTSICASSMGEPPAKGE